MATFVICLVVGLTPVGDTVLLKDGRTIVGQVIDPAPRAGGAAILVTRARADKEWPDLLKRADDLEAPRRQKARTVLVRSLRQWKAERKSAAGDRISQWIELALAEAQKPEGSTSSQLVELRLKSAEIKTVTKQGREARVKLAKAWEVGVDGAEDFSSADLDQALQGRGVDPKAIGPVSLDRLLPPKTESGDRWLIRRAATEVQNDEGLRFLKYESMIMPEPAPGQAPNLQTALGSIGNLTSLLSGEAPRDPWPDRLREVEARGRVGAVLTSLRMSADFTQVSVEVTLWVKLGPDRWVASGTRSGVMRTDALPANAGAELANDPQVKSIFQVVEGLGLGQVPEDLKRRSLNMGSATKQALGMARETADRDLQSLAIDLSSPRP